MPKSEFLMARSNTQLENSIEFKVLFWKTKTDQVERKRIRMIVNT